MVFCRRISCFFPSFFVVRTISCLYRFVGFLYQRKLLRFSPPVPTVYPDMCKYDHNNVSYIDRQWLFRANLFLFSPSMMFYYNFGVINLRWTHTYTHAHNRYPLYLPYTRKKPYLFPGVNKTICWNGCIYYVLQHTKYVLNEIGAWSRCCTVSALFTNSTHSHSYTIRNGI